MDFLGIDPISFAAGVAAATTAFGGVKAKGFFSKRGLSHKLETAQKTYSDKYVELEKSFQESDNEIDAAVHELIEAFPEESNKRHLTNDDMKATLNTYLEALNELKNTNVSKERLPVLIRQMDRSSAQFKINISEVEAKVRSIRYGIRSTTGFRNSIGKNRTNLESLYAKVQSRKAEAEKVFDPIYLDRLAPLALTAERAYERFLEHKPDTSFNYNAERSRHMYGTGNTYKYLLEKANEHLGKLDRYLDRTFSYSDRAIRQAAKLKVELRNNYYALDKYPHLKEHHDKAFEAITEAEKADYSNGNPEKTFADLVEPYETFKKMWQDRNKSPKLTAVKSTRKAG